MSNKQIEVHPITSRGQKFAVTVDDTGQFRALNSDGTEAASSETRADLARQLGKRTQQAQASVAVRFTTLGRWGKARRGTVTGIHAGNGNLIVVWDDDPKHTKVQFSRAGYDIVVLADMDDDTASEGIRLQKAKLQAETDYADWLSTWRLDLHQAVADAIGKAQSDAH